MLEKNAVALCCTLAPPYKDSARSSIMTEHAFTPVAHLDDIPADTVKSVCVAGRDILIVHHQNQLFAVENRCSHAEMPLECGRVRYGWIACPAHGARFDLASGEPLSSPATAPIATFALQIVDGQIEIAV